VRAHGATRIHVPLNDLFSLKLPPPPSSSSSSIALLDPSSPTTHEPEIGDGAAMRAFVDGALARQAADPDARVKLLNSNRRVPLPRHGGARHDRLRLPQERAPVHGTQRRGCLGVHDAKCGAEVYDGADDAGLDVATLELDLAQVQSCGRRQIEEGRLQEAGAAQELGCLRATGACGCLASKLR